MFATFYRTAWLTYRILRLIVLFLRHFAGQLPIHEHTRESFNIGLILVPFFILQFLTGFYLSTYYEPEPASEVFNNIHNIIIKKTVDGHIIHPAHENGPTCIFILLFYYFGRLLYNRVYHSCYKITWFVNITICSLIYIITFLGHLLPWSFQSFLYIKLMFEMVLSTPYIGDFIILYFFNSTDLENITLKFPLCWVYDMHIFWSYILLGFLILHAILFLNTKYPYYFSMEFKYDEKHFQPIIIHNYIHLYYSDIALFCVLFFSLYISLPTLFIDTFKQPEDFISAADTSVAMPFKPFIPKWYFMPLYMIVKAFPTKLGSLFGLFSFPIILFILPYLDSSPMWLNQRLGQPWIFFLLFLIILKLTTLGYTYYALDSSKYFTHKMLVFFLFFYFLIVIPIFSFFELSYVSRLKKKEKRRRLSSYQRPRSKRHIWYNSLFYGYIKRFRQVWRDNK